MRCFDQAWLSLIARQTSLSLRLKVFSWEM